MLKKFGFLFWSIILINSNVNGQLSRLGEDYNPILKTGESIFLKSYFQENNVGFNFLEKKIGFALIDLEIFLISKYNFFENWANKNDSTYSKMLYILNSKEKIESGNFDALIIFYKKNKVLKERRLNKLFKKFAQSENNKPDNLYQLGLNNDEELSINEANFFNKSFFKEKKEFDFKNKKIGFFNGNNGSRLWSKKEYFDDLKQRASENRFGPLGYLIILTEEQKTETGGYDAVIVSWSKLLGEILTKKMITKLKNNGA
jgi:RNase H-fold protein (predicted Holliday junction resolvase)